MAQAGSYVVVKFVPDEIRFEPINIGLVVLIADRLVTRMAQSIDPRVRYADPFTDTDSLLTFLTSFDAEAFADARGWRHAEVADRLGSDPIPNIFFTAPSEIQPSRVDDVDNLIEALFSRLVARSFSRPPEATRAPTTSAARTALRRALRDVGAFRRRLVQPSVAVRGMSGADWELDFRFLTKTHENLVKTATTSVTEEVRRREHGYEAFTALIETARPPAVRGVMAADADPAHNETSAQLSALCAAHGFDFLGGQRSFFAFARELIDKALPIDAPPRSNTTARLFDNR